MIRWTTFSYNTSNMLDAGVGTGIFVKHLIKGRHKAGINTPVFIDCVDIDSHVLTYAKKGIASRPLEKITFIEEDFLRFDTSKRYASIISNPPYFKHHYISDKAETVSAVKELTGFSLTVTTNIYCLFMFRARALMATPGRCAFIVPSEFLNADYGVQVKQHLLADKAFKGIIVFNFKTLIFDDSLTTACIVLFETGSKLSQDIKFVSLDNPDELDAALRLFESRAIGKTRSAHTSTQTLSFKREQLDAARKWRNYLSPRQLRSNISALVSLSKYARCSRGIATGANDFFTLSESKRQALGISLDDLLPCVTKSADVPSLIFTKADFAALSEKDSRLYLLNPKQPLSPELTNYLDEGVEREIHTRHLPSHRETWFLPERQTPAPIWVMVFSRGRTRFVWNKAGTYHLTTFHGVYPNPLGTAFFAPLLVYLWSDSCQHMMEEQQRQYGNGLKKYEPRDIERILVPDFEAGETAWISEAKRLVKEAEKVHRTKKTIIPLLKKIEDYFSRTWLAKR